MTHVGEESALGPIGRFGRLRVALSRIDETEDDELAYAYYAANHAEKRRMDALRPQADQNARGLG